MVNAAEVVIINGIARIRCVANLVFFHLLATHLRARSTQGMSLIAWKKKDERDRGN